jgi:FkbM family methyltransferase
MLKGLMQGRTEDARSLAGFHDVQQECLARLINVELKLNQLAVSASGGYGGHADQAFGHVTYSQFGEDLIIANIFAKLEVSRPTYIDVGAHHPWNVSNTALLYTRGSSGVNVEANPNLVDAFAVERPRDITLNVGVGPLAGELDFYFIDDFSGRNTFDKATAESFVAAYPQFSIREKRKIPVVTLDEVVRSACGGKWPDFLSLDAEGLDYDILASANMPPAQPSVICVEAVSGDSHEDGARLTDFLAERGYRVEFRTLGNLILVHEKFLDKAA